MTGIIYETLRLSEEEHGWLRMQKISQRNRRQDQTNFIKAALFSREWIIHGQNKTSFSISKTGIATVKNRNFLRTRIGINTGTEVNNVTEKKLKNTKKIIFTLI